MMADRNSARRVWRRCRTDANYSRYRRLRNATQICIRRAKCNYFVNYFNNSNITETWNKLRCLGLIKSKASNQVLRYITEDLSSSFASFSHDERTLTIELDNFDAPFSDDNFYFKDILTEDVIKAFKRNKSLAVGFDEMPLKLLRIVFPFILPVVLHIYNCSLMYGVFPTIWKTALIVPLSKNSSPSSPQHYRPISILCSLAKTFERLVDQIVNYLEKHSLFDEFQSAYRRGFSTQTALEF